jgi:hypothetical protein
LRRKPLLPVVLSLFIAAKSLGARDACAQSSDPQQVAAAQALFEQASAALDRKDYATACPKLEEVVRLVPDGIGAHLALGECYEGLGRLASAWTSYVRTEAIATQTKQLARKKEAQKRAEALRPRLAQLTITVPDAVRALPGLSITRDGIPVGAAQWGLSLPVDKGKHVIVVMATGRPRWEKTIQIDTDGASETATIEVPAAPADKPAPSSSASPPADKLPTESPPAAADRAASSVFGGDVERSHRRQVGLTVRVDSDLVHRLGVRFAPGLTYGLSHFVEVGASALVGRTMGFEPQATLFILHGAWKPLVNAGVPVFIVDGVTLGIRGAAGLQWDPFRHFGLFMQLGGVYFFNSPDGYARALLVPSGGLQGRL